MKILSIDCSAGPASVALVEFDKSEYEVLAYEFKNEGLTHSQTLVPMMDSVIKKSGTFLSDVDYFAINAGPGSFTGVRIGVAALKGLTALDGENCIPVSTLLSMAYNYADIPGKHIVCASMDARCQQTYAALFEVHDGVVTRLSEDEALMVESLGENIINNYYKNKIIFVGDGANLCYNILKSKIDCSMAEEEHLWQNAISVALAAKNELDRGFQPITSAEILPIYLRAPQAERELKRRNS